MFSKHLLALLTIHSSKSFPTPPIIDCLQCSFLFPSFWQYFHFLKEDFLPLITLLTLLIDCPWRHLGFSGSYPVLRYAFYLSIFCGVKKSLSVLGRFQATLPHRHYGGSAFCGQHLRAFYKHCWLPNHSASCIFSIPLRLELDPFRVSKKWMIV